MAVSSVYSEDKQVGRVELIRKMRRLPLPGEVLVKKGDKVLPDTPVAKIAPQARHPLGHSGCQVAGYRTFGTR